VDTNIVR